MRLGCVSGFLVFVISMLVNAEEPKPTTIPTLPAKLANLEGFDWRKNPCPTEDIIGGKDFNRVLAEEFFRAELEGWRNGEGGGQCLKPETYRFFKVAVSEPGDDGVGQKVRLKSVDEIQIVSVTRFPSESSENLKLVKYALKSVVAAPAKAGKKEKGKGKRRGRGRRGVPEPVYGDFVFERILGSGEYKDSFGCAAMFRPPTHLLTANCPTSGN